MGVCFQLFCFGFFFPFPFHTVEVLSHTVAAAIVNYLSIQGSCWKQASSWNFPWQYAETGAVSGHCWLLVQLQFSEQTFYFSGLLWERYKQLSGWTAKTVFSKYNFFFFFFFNCTWNVCDEITLYTYSVFEKFHAWPYYFIFLSLIATLGRLLTGIAISKIRPKLSAILICVPVQSPSTCSSVWLRNSQPLSHYVRGSSCVGWDKLCFVEACMTFL